MNQEIILSYDGVPDPSKIDCLYQILEKKLQTKIASLKIRKKIYFITVELLQNILKNSLHLGIDNVKLPQISFEVKKHANKFLITTENSLLNQDCKVLEDRLSKINSMSAKEIKTVYRKYLEQNTIVDGGGAGLGFIDMVRRTGDKINYEIWALDDIYSRIRINISLGIDDYVAA